MSNLQNTPTKEYQKLTVVYPSHEDAVSLVLNESFPIENILIGITHPYSSYHINRVATNKYYLFEYILEGKGEIHINGKWYPLTQGDTYIISKKDSHNYHSDKKNPLKKIWISFASDYIDKMFESYQIKTGIYRVDTKDFFQSIYNISKTNTPPQSKFFTIANNLHSIITTVASSVLDTQSDNVSVIKSELQASIYSKKTLDDIAKQLFISKSTLIRLFKNDTGITPYQFLLNEKMKIAKTLLRTTTMHVKNISELLCFTDEHYFSFLFKEKTGKSPSEYRKSP